MYYFYGLLEELPTGVAGNPFEQFDWSKPFPIRLSKPQADVYRQHLLTNPIPLFSSDADWSKPVRIRLSKPYPDFYRQHLLTNPIPFAQYNWANTSKVNTSAPQPYVYNQNLYAVVVTVTVDPRAPVFSRIVTRIANPSDKTWPNLVLTAPVAAPPFAQKDWPKSTPVRIGNVDSYNIVLFDGSVPFNQFDWSKTTFSKPRAPNQQLYNLALLTQVAVAVPFYQTNWPSVQNVKFAPPQPYVFNPNLFVGIVQSPFFKTDWSDTFWPIPSKPQSTPLNLCLYTNPIPFAQYDWGKWRTVKISKQFDQQPGYLNFYTNQLPFAQYDWSKPVRVPVDRGQNTGVNLNLFRNPIPVFNRPSTVTNPIRFTSVPQTVNFQLLFAIPVVVTVSFDPFVKKRSKPKRDRLREELEIKYKRRLAIEEAFWPPTTYELPEYKLPEHVKPAPDVSDLANVIMQVHAMRAAQTRQHDEEDEKAFLELLKREYGITDV